LGYDQAMRWTQVPAGAWRTPQELVEEGFRRGRVAMLNEARDGLTRCVRTGRVGRQILPGACDGCSAPAVEALGHHFAALVAELVAILERDGGTAGMLREEAAPLACWPGWTP
jgi:hypothetical protein